MRNSIRPHTLAPLILVAACAPILLAQGLPRGQIVDSVACASDPTQSYSLYLPSSYSPDRPSSLLVGFHPRARGRAIVETYQAAAETYGYIVAASNNSRNGPWDVSIASAQATLTDVGKRFHIDANRVYLTGHSGGARVALGVALGTKVVAGVIVSSAGYPDNRTRKSLPFVLFGTAGTEDFNYLELRQVDRALTTPHRLAVFEGGHTLPPPAVAVEAIEWLELHAMKSGKRSRDEALIDRLFAKRQSAVAAAATAVVTVHLLRGLVEDFSGVRDVAATAARAAELSKQKDVKAALARERSDDEAESRRLNDVFALEAELADEGERIEGMARLREILVRAAQQAASATDSPDRQRARRLLRTIAAGAADRVQDREYLELIERYRLKVNTPG